MIDYQAIVEREAAALGATVHDVFSEEAADRSEFLAARAWIARLEGRDATEFAWSDCGSRQIFVRLPVDSELGCVIALDELGHIDTSIPGEDEMFAEAKATAWALAHLGFEVSSDTAEATLAAFESYLPEAA